MTHSDNFENYRSLLPLFLQIIGVCIDLHKNFQGQNRKIGDKMASGMAMRD